MTTTPETTTAPAPIPDVEQPESAKRLLKVLDDVAKNAKHAADPRQPAEQIAVAFAAYLRAPD